MNEALEFFRASARAELVVDAARRAGDEVHEIVKRYVATMPTVTAATGLGLVVMQQIYAETVHFAVASMDGDAADGAAVMDGARRLARELLAIADGDEPNAENGASPNE